MAQRYPDRLEPAETGARLKRLATVSRQLYFVAVLVMAIIVGVVGHHLWEVRAALMSDAERQVSRLDMAFAEQTGRAVETVDLLLRETVELARLPPAARPDLRRLGQVLHSRLDGVRQVGEILLTDADGHVLASSASPAAAALPDSLTQEIARRLRQATADLQFGAPVRLPDGTWTVLMVRGIPGEGGALAGIVVGCLNLRYFEDFYQAVELSENGAITLLRRDGVALARYPHNDAVEGVNYADSLPFQDVLAHAPAGALVMDSPLDGSRRVVAVRALRAFPLVVATSVDLGMVLAPWRMQAFILCGAALVAGCLVVALLVVLAQRSREVGVLVGEYRAAQEAAEQATVRLREQMAERERAEAALRQAQSIEVIGQLTGGVAHDFNNLLTVVLGNLEVLEHDGRLDRGQLGLLATIRTAAERGASLTSQLLAFARRQPLLASSVDVGKVLSGMSDLMQSALGSRIQVVTMLQPALWHALIDPTQVELVILNLAINARDAMPDGGTLTLTAGNVTLGPPERPEQPQAGEYVRVVVSDTGIGMAPDVLAKAFEPFFTTKGPGRGSGLGLSQVYGVVRQSGGLVQIESTPGQGTRVTVFLPRAVNVVPQAGALPASAEPRAKPADVAVLLVDDDNAVRATTAKLLRYMGYGVAEAESGPAALELLRSGFEPDVVVSDVAMPGMSGPALARQLAKHWPTLPVVFVSGYADPESVAGGDRMQRLVRKPFRPADLAAQLEAALADRRAGV